MALSLESRSYTAGGKRYRENRLYDPHTPYISSEEAKCCSAIFFGPVDGVLGVLARLGLWTGLGAAVGACSGSGAGAGPGAIIGFCLGCFSFLCPCSQ